MADHYVKLWASIVDSSVWKEPDRHRIVWVTMLTMADKNGFVGASVDGLARRANVPEEDVESALKAFLSPDPRSRNREHDGRRIQEVPRGWHILNHGYFRDLQAKEEMRAYERDRKRGQRSKDVPDSPGHVPDNVGQVPDKPDKLGFVPSASSGTGTDSASVSERESTRERTRKQIDRPEDVPEQVWTDWLSHRKAVKAPVTATVLTGLAREAAKAGMSVAEAMTTTVTQGWKGFRADYVAQRGGTIGKRPLATTTGTNWTGPSVFLTDD